jgi:hypothetical protein
MVTPIEEWRRGNAQTAACVWLALEPKLERT